MKRLLDLCVLTAVFILLYSVFICSVDGGIVRRNRTMKDPSMIVPGAKIVANPHGGHNYIKNGRTVAYSAKNVAGSYDVWVMGHLKYRGLKFVNSEKYRDMRPASPKSKRDRTEHVYVKPQQSSSWTVRRKAEIERSGMKWWELTNPGTYNKTK